MGVSVKEFVKKWCFTSASFLSFMAMTPAIKSWWPERYLVPEWYSMSAPRSRVFCRYGDIMVLSTTTIAGKMNK